MTRVAVLASTRGTDMDALLSLEGCTLALVIVTGECGALERATAAAVPTAVVQEKSRTARDREIMRHLDEHAIDLVVMIGYMRLVGREFVQRWRNRIMNIHPSLLPAFAGGMDRNVHEAVLERGCKITGCTLHFVDEGADTGPIIIQKAVRVEEDDTPERLKQRVQEAEKEALREGVTLFSEGRLHVKGNRVIIV